jgi:hypothetical protein
MLYPSLQSIRVSCAGNTTVLAVRHDNDVVVVVVVVAVATNSSVQFLFLSPSLQKQAQN